MSFLFIFKFLKIAQERNGHSSRYLKICNNLKPSPYTFYLFILLTCFEYISHIFSSTMEIYQVLVRSSCALLSNA